MRVYHATKTERACNEILRERKIRLGRNVSSVGQPYAHVSTNPFHPGSWALDVFGPDTNLAWLIEFEIPDETPLLSDPADEAGEDYNGGWCVSPCEIPILRVYRVTFVRNVQRYEMGEKGQIKTTFKGDSS